MLPSLKEGDIVFFKKYKKDKCSLKKGEIVIFHNPINNQREIKRIKKIEKICIEVLGDNLENSIDSRSFGLVQKEKIIGIVTTTF
tara:strand:- start:787 stop:1041 length:255 start_codon:yes stop_codon:yes gene_type:complete